jgi:hypothetical protein
MIEVHDIYELKSLSLCQLINVQGSVTFGMGFISITLIGIYKISYIYCYKSAKVVNITDLFSIPCRNSDSWRFKPLSRGTDKAPLLISFDLVSQQ